MKMQQKKVMNKDIPKVDKKDDNDWNTNNPLIA